MSQSEIKNLLTKNVFPTKIFSKIFCYSLKERKKKKGKKKAKLSRNSTERIANLTLRLRAHAHQSYSVTCTWTIVKQEAILPTVFR